MPLISHVICSPTLVTLVILCVILHSTLLTFFNYWAVGAFTKSSAYCGLNIKGFIRLMLCWKGSV